MKRQITIAVAALTVLLSQVSSQAGTTVSGNLAATSVEAFYEAMRYIDQKDEGAFAKLMATGRIVVLKGEKAEKIEGSQMVDSRLIAIRIRGKRQTLWTTPDSYTP